jgi:hypothetical protein
MRRPLAILVLFLFFAQPVSAKQASLQDRLLLSQTVANYINDPDYKGYKYFNGAHAVEIGAAVIEGNGALADWRSVDGKNYGQVAFFHLCDAWNVLSVSNKVPLRAEQIRSHWGITKNIASVLIAQLRALEPKHVVYLKPPQAQQSC